MGECRSNASCRSWHPVGLGVLLCFYERFLKWERAVLMRLVGLGVLLCVLASCRVFRMHLEMGVCHTNVSCRSWRLVVFFEGVLK